MILIALAAESPAQSPSKREQDLKQLARLQSEFLKDQQQARAAAGAQFDTLVNEMSKKPNIGGSERASLVRKWTDEKERFLKYEELQPHADLADLAIEYGFRVSDQYRPLGKRYDLLIGETLRLGENKSADQMLSDKEQFERAHLAGRREFATGTVWQGTRQNRANTVPFRLAVHNVTGDVFQGRVDINGPVTDHPAFEVRGLIDGTRLQISTGRQLQGKPEQFNMEGVVIGKSIFLRMAGVKARRGGGARPAGGFIVASKK
ncbi:MAG: hypothetical protein WD669_08195 [Pirellulales bacterium]